MATTSATTDLRVTDDVVIVGGGLAGLYCALKMAPRPVTLIASAPLGDGATATWSRDDIATAGQCVAAGERHVADTVAAGAGLSLERMVALMTRDGAARLRDLEAYGLSSCDPDAGGTRIIATLSAAVRETPSIRVIDNCSVEDLVRDGGRVTGLIAIARPDDGTAHEIRIRTRAVIIATGGVGALFAVTTKSPYSCGEGLAIAARAGALLADAEFVQFVPAAGEAGAEAPAAHFHMGGVLTDASGRTSVDGLWACGEAAATGVHGARLFGPNALLEAIVFAARAAADVRDHYPAARDMPAPHVVSESEGPGLFLETAAIDCLRHTMTEHVGARRDHAGLVAALDAIAALERQGGPSHGFRNMITTARLIACTALMRTESRGAHVRDDFPDADPARASRATFTLRAMEAEARAIVEDTVRRFA